MRWEKYKVPLLELGLIIAGAVAIISLASVFILNARLKSIQTEQTVVRETTAVEERSALEQQLMVYGSSDEKALVMTNSFPMQGLAGDDLIYNESEDVCAASDADGRYYVWRISDGELLTTYASTSYDRALLIGQNRILLEDSGYFYCFDYTSGMQLWKWQFPYENCIWQYDSAGETLYAMSTDPDVQTQTVTTEVLQNDQDDDDWDDDWDDDDWDDNQQIEEQSVITSIRHDIYVLNVNSLEVNYIRPTDLLTEERNYKSAEIYDITLSDDKTYLLMNGCLSDLENQNVRYFSRIYNLSDISFAPETTDNTVSGYGEDTEESQVTDVTYQTSEIVREVTAFYNEGNDTGYRMISRWIDNESLLQYSESIPEEQDSDNSAENYNEDSDDGSTDADAAGNAIEISDRDELDEEPVTVEWSIRKRTLPYASTAWRIRGSGEPTDDPRLCTYTDGENSYIIVTLDQCALTLGSQTGQEVGATIDTDDFIYIEPKGQRPTMLITTDGSVIQGKRHYGLGVSDIKKVAKIKSSYYVSAENSVFIYTMAGNVAKSGIPLTGSDEIIWNRATFSQDGAYAVLSGQRYLRLYRTEDGTRLYQNISQLSAGADAVFCGNRLCHLDASGRNLMIYDLSSGNKERVQLTGTAVIQKTEIRSWGDQYVLVASEDGQLLWVIDTEAMAINRTISSKDICELTGLDVKKSTVEYCRMSPDAKYLVYSVRVSDDAGALTLEAFVTELSSGETIESEDLASKLDVAAEDLPAINTAPNVFSQDGHFAIFKGSNNAIGVLDLEKASFAHETNCGDLAVQPVFTPAGSVVCVTAAGDVCVINADSGNYVAIDDEGKAYESRDIYSMDRLDQVTTLSFDGTKMYAAGVKNGKTFIRAYTISDNGILTPETEIPSAAAAGAGKVLMRYGDAEAEIFPYLTLDELKEMAAAED